MLGGVTGTPLSAREAAEPREERGRHPALEAPDAELGAEARHPGLGLLGNGIAQFATNLMMAPGEGQACD